MAQNQAYGNAYNEDDNYADSGTQANQTRIPISSPPQQQQGQQQGITQQQPTGTNTNNVNNNNNQSGSPPQQSNSFAKFCDWFPLRIFAFLGGLAFIATPILDLIFARSNSFINIVVFTYLIFFGIVIMFVESPTWKCTRKCQLRIFFWFKLLSRTWGRAVFYFFISFLAFSQANTISGTRFIVTILSGVWIIMIAIMMTVFSFLAGRSYNTMYNYMVKGEEGDAAAKNIMKYFNMLDADQDGKIGSLEIHKLADESGKHLSNAERHAIQTFLDESCNGHVTKEDWMKQWLTYNPYAQKIRFV